MRKRIILALMLLAVVIGATLGWRFMSHPAQWFVEHPIPLANTYRLFDLGVVDANGDDRLDIYTSNHHFRQNLLIAGERGGLRDVLSEWGLDQSLDFPQAELSFVPPTLDKAGIYIYWLGTRLVIRAHKTGAVGPLKGELRVNDPVDVVKNDGFQVDIRQQSGPMPETILEFASPADGLLILNPGGQGLPIRFQLAGDIDPAHVYVGRGKVSPASTSFSLAMRDRHAIAWADYNDDGLLDIFANRGALSGTLRAHSEEVQRGINDELLVSQGSGPRYADVASEKGIHKRGCSGRHARWADFNQDGLLDLYINCQDRAHVEGQYPKQLYRQNRDRHFDDVAAQVGLDLPERELIDFVWGDPDNDGDMDLVTSEDTGFYLYRQDKGTFSREFIGRGEFVRADDPSLKGTVDLAWFADGKLTVSDFNSDGYPDVFSASRSGNVLLLNRQGRYAVIDPRTVGLPRASLTAGWVDYDNDGLPDLHAIPQGMYRQSPDRTFEATGLLELPDDGRYRAAIVNWFDLENDGRRDVVMALSVTPDFKRWWEFKPPPRKTDEWTVLVYRNVGPSSHWLQIGLAGAVGNRQGIGARVTVVTPDGQQVQAVGDADGAFFSQGHYRLYFGLGHQAKAERVRIRWPDGQEQELADVTGDRLLTVEHKR